MLSTSFTTVAIVAASLASSAVADNKPTFSVNKLPNTWEKGQVGTNSCKQFGASSDSSKCQNIFMNSLDDFCLWAPISGQKEVGANEEKQVSYCLRSGYGTRLIPNGAIKQAHFVKTPDFLQVTGSGDFTKMHVKSGDEGGELDPHGATGAGNPPGGLVFTKSAPGKNAQWTQMHEWSSFMSATEFSFRACFDSGDNATKYCPHVYDEMGAQWNHPGDYDSGFTNCDGDSGHFPGVFHGSTFSQNSGNTPKAHKAGKTSNCQTSTTVSNQAAQQTPYKRGPIRADTM
ncbi:unnamed protein product [Jaminaea pallidilutea]